MLAKSSLLALSLWLLGSAAHADIIAKPYTFTPNTPAQAAQVNADFDTIYNNYNGNITNANIKAGAAISFAKISFTSGQLGPILRAANQPCISVGTTGDANARTLLYSNGGIYFQDPVSAAPIVLNRENVFGGNKFSFWFDNTFSSYGQCLAAVWQCANPGDTGQRVYLSGASGGSLAFGSGSTATPDVMIKRSDANTMAIRDWGDTTNKNLNAGVLTLTTPLTKANINNGVVRKELVVPVVNGTITDGATYTLTIPIKRACTITAICASIGTAIVGGTNTLSITNGAGTSLLSTATVDPTTFAANATTTLTQGATTTLAAGDCVKITHVAGTQGTDGVAESVAIEIANDDI